MNYYYEQPQYNFGLNRHFTQAVKYLIIANGIIFFLQMLLGDSLIIRFGLLPRLIYTKFYIWQLVSYMFLHGDFIHILLNMFILWMFGCEIERNLGYKNFLIYYFTCGIGAGIFHVLIFPNSITPVIGASGAIYGLLAAFAMMFPDRPIMLFPFFITLKAKNWVLIFVGISLLFGLVGLTGRQDGIAHFVHLGGALIGFLFLKYGWRLDKIGNYFKKKTDEKKLISLAKKRRKLQELRNEVDSILDKINEHGYENLTEKEKKKLKEASNLFSKE